MGARRTRNSKHHIIGIVALISFALWAIPEAIDGISELEIRTDVIWLAALVCAIAGVAFAERVKIKKLRTLLIGDNEAFCIGSGSFSFFEANDLVRSCHDAVSQVSYANRPLPLDENFNPTIIVTTTKFRPSDNNSDTSPIWKGTVSKTNASQSWQFDSQEELRNILQHLM